MLLWDRMLIKSVGTPRIKKLELRSPSGSFEIHIWGWKGGKQKNVSNKTSYYEHASAAGKDKDFFSNGFVKKTFFFIVLCLFLTSEMLRTAIFL